MFFPVYTVFKNNSFHNIASEASYLYSLSKDIWCFAPNINETFFVVFKHCDSCFILFCKVNWKEEWLVGMMDVSKKREVCITFFCKGIFLEVEVAEGLLAKVQGNWKGSVEIDGISSWLLCCCWLLKATSKLFFTAKMTSTPFSKTWKKPTGWCPTVQTNFWGTLRSL